MNLEYFTAGIAYSPEAKAVIDMSGNADVFKPGPRPITTQGHRVAPWGDDNTLPFKVLDMIEKNEVVSSNIQFNIQSAYGLGIKPMMKVRSKDGTVIGYKECTDQAVLDFFEENDIDGYYLESITDMMTFFNVFPEIILSNDRTKIASLRHLEASFSRWGAMGANDKQITKHLYCDWEGGRAKKDQLTVTPVLARYRTLEDLKNRVSDKNGGERFVLQVSMPTPGRSYYANPWWWSIFRSGWYDISVMLPNYKKALLKNHLAVRYVIYISDKYWEDVLRLAKVPPGDVEKEKVAKEEAVKGILDFLTGEDSKGGGMISTRRIMPGGSGKPFEDKYIQIEKVEATIKGGEFIEDAEEANNIISYAMGVHPNLNGATPGKGKGSLGGSDKRELFMIHQAKMRPFRDRLLKPLNLIKKFNGWPADLEFVTPEYEFPTLDVNKSGNQKVIQE